MSKVVTVMNMKGGVGKTTVALHVAGITTQYVHKGAEQYKKVLLIDYDPQFNLSQSLLSSQVYFEREKARLTTLSILTDDDTNINPFQLQVPGSHTPPSPDHLSIRILKTSDGHLDLIPSTLDLMYVALGQANNQTQPMEERFDKFIAECRRIYDLIVIDCHPAGSIFTKTSLRNSDSVIIPVAPERYALRGIGLMTKFIDAKSVAGKKPSPLILFNRTKKGQKSQMEISIRGNPLYAPYCLANTMHQYKAFQEPEEGKGFVWRSRKPYSTEAFHNILKVTREVLTRL